MRLYVTSEPGRCSVAVIVDSCRTRGAVALRSGIRASAARQWLSCGGKQRPHQRCPPTRLSSMHSVQEHALQLL